MKDRVFFSGLNELRAFAALAVVWHHVELYKKRLDIFSLYDYPIISNIISGLGKNGVFLFFVLSGFLITYLLLEEKQKTGKISVRQFYARRILRIWPLYFIIVVFSFFVLPPLYFNFQNFFDGQTFYNGRIENLVYGPNLLLFVFFLSNIALNLYGPVVGASQSWSVSVEEQFYLIWPWIVKFFSKMLVLSLLIIILIASNRQGVLSIIERVECIGFLYPFLKAFINTFHVEYMAMGGLMAVIYRKQSRMVLTLIRNKWLFFLVVFLLGVQLHSKISNILFSLNMGILILMFIEQKVKIGIFDRLGKISYGIYMYHPLMMYFSFSLAARLGITELYALNVFVYPLILLLTFGVSHLSYKFIELYFLKLKDRFSSVKSGAV